MKTAFIITIFAVLAVVFFPVTFALMAISPAFIDSEKA
jgi:hypothetical protein